jgi:hypothetical protein
MFLRAIDQAALVKSTGNSGNSCNMRAKGIDILTAGWHFSARASCLDRSTPRLIRLFSIAEMDNPPNLAYFAAKDQSLAVFYKSSNGCRI